MNNENAFILATSTGEGISELFLELGADAVLPCASTDSLSDGDFASAILASGSRCVLLLPNGESAYESAEGAARSCDSIRVSAEGAARSCDSIRVSVLPTRSFAEGYAALAAMPRGESTGQLYRAALPGISSVTSIDIVREWGQGCFFGQYSAISHGERYSLAGSAEAALLESVERLFDKEKHRIITLIVGKGVTNARRVFVTERLMEIYPDAQIIVYIGGQTATEYYIALR